MKKILLASLFLCLVANPILAVAQTKGIPNIKRVWECLTTPDKSKCTKTERNKAKVILATTAVSALVVALAAIGITTVKAKQIYDMKEEDKQMKEFAESGKDLSFYPRLVAKKNRLLKSLDAIKKDMVRRVEKLNIDWAYSQAYNLTYIADFKNQVTAFNTMTKKANRIIDQLNELKVTLQEIKPAYNKYKEIIEKLYPKMRQAPRLH